MRCDCCDRILSDSEATAKFKESGTYTNMCNTCVKSLPSEIEIVTRTEPDEEYEEDFEEEDDGDEEE